MLTSSNCWWIVTLESNGKAKESIPKGEDET